MHFFHSFYFYLNLCCVSCTQLIVKSFLSNLINSAIFIWLFRPFIYNVIIDMARFTLAILLSFFHLSPAFFVSQIPLWMTECGTLLPLLTISHHHLLQMKWTTECSHRLWSSQLVLALAESPPCREGRHVQGYSGFLGKGFVDLFKWPLLEVLPAIDF